MRDEQSGLTTMLAYGVGGALLLALIVYMVFAPKEVSLDPTTFCPRSADQSSPRTTVIVVDRTDPITEVQQQDIRGYVSDALRNALPRERFVIYALDARKDIVLDGKVRCNPLGPKANGLLAELSDDKSFDAKRFKEQFLDPMVAKVATLLPTATTTQTDSPIMELIQAVAVRDLKRSPKGRLILISDLMQHSARYSQYRAAPNFDAFARSVAFKELAVDLSNTDVEVLYITRTQGPSHQPPEHIEFWHRYFSALRANSILIRAVRGEGWK